MAERFWPKVDKQGPDDCWVWLASKANGYGRFYDRNADGKVPAHRVAFQLAHGPVPVGLVVDHTCENKACVNPAHLEAVAFSVNVERALSKGDVCAQGHPLDGLKRDKMPDGSPRIRRYCRTCSREGSKRCRERREQEGR